MAQGSMPSPTNKFLELAESDGSGAKHDPLFGWVAGILAIFGPLMVWGTGVWLAARTVPSKVGGGECEGISLACTSTPRALVLFSGGFLGLFIVPVATVATIAAWLMRSHSTPPQRLVRVIVVLAVLATGVVLFGIVETHAARYP